LTSYAGSRVVRTNCKPGVDGRASRQRIDIPFRMEELRIAFWDDVRSIAYCLQGIQRPGDERHVTIATRRDRACMRARIESGRGRIHSVHGVGSEVFGAVINGRRRHRGGFLRCLKYAVQLPAPMPRRHDNSPETSLLPHERSEYDLPIRPSTHARSIRRVQCVDVTSFRSLDSL